MRKALIAFCLLFTLCVGGAVAVAVDVNSVRDQVIFTEEVVFGDKTAVEGLTVKAEAALDDGRLHWHSTYTIGAENETDTEYFFSAKRPDRPVNYEPSGLMINSQSRHSYWDWDQAESAEELSGVARAYWELFQNAPDGEEVSRTVRMADYDDYYPFNISVDLPNYYMDWNGKDDWNIGTPVTEEQMENMEQLYHTLSECLKIPVLPTETMEIHLTRNGDHVNSWGSGMGEGEWYEPWCYSTVTEDACYFIVWNRTGEDNLMDMSQLSKGYGIYRIPYAYSEEDFITMTAPEKLEMVYPLDEESEVCWLDTTTDGSRLILLTGETNGDYLLRIIDCASMETLQEQVLYNEKEHTTSVRDCRENYILLCSSDGGIILFEEKGDGTFTRKLDLDLTEEEMLSGGFHTTHWDGERLVLAYPLTFLDYDDNENCGFGVAVYDESGALFGGKYRSSLDTKTFSWHSGANCYLWSNDCLHISWK